MPQVALVERLSTAETGAVVGVLANAAVATSESAMGECLAKAAELEGNLDAAGWDIFEAIGKLADDRRAKAEEIVREVREALVSDEHVVQLAPALRGAQAKAVQLLTKLPEVPPPAPPPGPGLKPEVRTGWRVVQQGSREGLSIDDAEKCLSGLKRDVKPGERVRINVGWVVEGGGGDS